jgi:hypothetical protein
MLASSIVSSMISSMKHALPISIVSNGYLLMSKMFSSTVMLPKEIFMAPVLQFMKALAVAKKDHPRITGI